MNLRLITLAILGCAFGPAAAWAACTDPGGTAGDQFYNNVVNAMQYCNGSVWVDMGSTIGVGTLTANDLCTTDGTNIICTVGNPLPVGYGGTGAVSFMSNGILMGQGTGALVTIGTAANSILISNASGVPSFSTGLPSGFTIGTSSISGVMSLANGGTGASLTASNGGIFYSTSSAGAILSGTSTADQILMSGAGAAPGWSTATWPASTTQYQLLYSSATNTIAGLATANNSVLATNSSGAPGLSSVLPSTVQGNITATGVITSGTWNGTAIATQYGGLGGNFGSSSGALYITSGTVTAGTLAIGNGGTGATTAQAARGQTALGTASVGLNIDEMTIPSSSGNANYQILATDRTVAVGTTALTAARTWYLPLGSTVNAGQTVCVVDKGGGVSSTDTLTIAGAEGSSDTVEPSTAATIKTQYGSNCYASDGGTPAKWTSVGGGGGVPGGSNLQVQFNNNGSFGGDSGFTYAGSGGDVTITGALSIGTSSSPVSSALLDMASTSQGFLPPQMTNSQMNAIGNPTGGLTVYNTTQGELYTYNGSTWSAGAGGSGQLIGTFSCANNAGTSYSVTFTNTANTMPTNGTCGNINLPSNTSYIVVELWGSGGGGSGSDTGGSGGAGGYTCFSTSSSYTCQSAGGSGGSNATFYATGGGGGVYNGGGGAGGSGTSGDVNLTGSGGEHNLAATSGSTGLECTGASGGSSPAGGGGAAGLGSGAGVTGNAYGGGGSAGYMSGINGQWCGDGGGGGGYASKFISNPSGTYYYTIGGGGSAGSAGSSGNAGGGGGAGGIKISVYTTGVALGSIGSGTSGNLAYYNGTGTSLSSLAIGTSLEIAGGNLDLITPVSVSYGGTGQTTAQAARGSASTNTVQGLNIDEMTIPSSSGNTNYQILTTDRTVAVGTTALTAARTWTLPLGSQVNAGQTVCIVDKAGGISSTDYLTIAGAGSDTVEPSSATTIKTQFGSNCYTSDGGTPAKWTSVGGGGGVPGGSTTDVQFNNNGALAGDSGFTYAGNGGTIYIEGNVGIGTTGPGSLVDAFGSGDERITVRSSDTSTTNYTGFQLAGGASGNFNGGMFENNASKGVVELWDSSNSPVLTLNGSNVGIGTTAPYQPLQVAGNVDVTGTNGYITEVANASSTGTTINALAKLTSTGAVIASTGDLDGMVGVVVGETAGGSSGVTSGRAEIAVGGQVYCTFDSAPSAIGDFVGISSNTAGDCHDWGSSRPVFNQTIGRVLSTTAVSGTYLIALQPGAVGTGGGELLGEAACTTAGSSYTVTFTGSANSAPSVSSCDITLASNTSYIVVELWGAGAGGCGGYNGSSYGCPSGGGGNSTFSGTGASLTADGGSVSSSSSYIGGAGGGASGGDINFTGGAGGTGDQPSSTGAGVGGQGGNGFWGGGGSAGLAGNGNGSAGSSGTGAGGGGGSTSGTTTGAGGGAGGYTRKFVNAPSGTYTYTIGAGGSGGTSTNSGGSGANGGIVVWAYASVNGGVTTGSLTSGGLCTTNGSNISCTTSTLGVSNGGTGDSTLTSNGVLCGNGTGAVQVTAQGAANSVLTANAGAPSFSASPTIGTSVTTPELIGGTAASSSLTEETTSGSGTSDFWRVLTGSQSERMRVTSGGNVGIGSTSPNFTLDVNGNINAGGQNIYLGGAQRITDSASSSYTEIKPQNGFLILNDNSHNEQFSIYASNGSDGIGLQATTSYASINATNGGSSDIPLVLQSANGGGDVGIGTTAPQAMLQVNGGVQVGTGNTCSSATAGEIEYVGGALTYCNGTSYAAPTASAAGSSGNIQYNSGSDALAASSTFTYSGGNVGIGTTAPQAALQVAGTIYSSSGGVEFPDGTTEKSAKTPTVCAGFSGGTCPVGATCSTTTTGTYTLPTGATWIEVEMVGGGSGGGGGNSGGSTAGGATTFGTSFLTANGGGSVDQAGNAMPSAATASGGDINISGAVGTQGIYNASDSATGGIGGASPFGGAGYGSYNSTGGSAAAGSGSGGGGGGTTAANTAGGNGGAAGAYLRKLISSPSSTYSYAVGCGGGGGSGETTGGTGGSGIIIVKEHYAP